MGCKQQRAGTIFYGESWPLEAPSKDFHLAIGGGLGWIKWLKNGQGKVLHFMQLFLHYILFGQSFTGYIKEPSYIQYVWKSWKNKIITKMWGSKRGWYFSNLLTISNTSLVLVTFSAVLLIKALYNFNPIEDGSFWGCSQIGRGQKAYIFYNYDTWHSHTLPKEGLKNM